MPNDVPTMTDGCSKAAWSNKGSFSFGAFDADAQNHYEAKGDLHQIGGGFGDHFWYAHTRNTATGSDNSNEYDLSTTPDVHGTMAITGTWKLSQPIDGWTRVMVHLPDTGSQTQDAVYTVDPGAGASQNRILNVHVKDNTWVSLGVFNFSSASGTQSVSLSNYAPDGTADEDVAWDAVAFQPLPAKPKDIVVQLGDSYSSGTGAGSYDYGTTSGPYASISSQTSPGHNWNACLRSSTPGSARRVFRARRLPSEVARTPWTGRWTSTRWPAAAPIRTTWIRTTPAAAKGSPVRSGGTAR